MMHNILNHFRVKALHSIKKYCNDQKCSKAFVRIDMACTILISSTPRVYEFSPSVLV
jgi:hypothetical protein